MNGFFAGGAAATAATWVGAVVTLAVWSYFFGGGRAFRLAQYLLAGLATGYLVLLAVRDVLLPHLVGPLLEDPGGRPLLWIALGLVAIVAASRWLPSSVVAVPVAFLVAGTAAFALGGAVVGSVLPQLGAAVMLPVSTPGGLVNGLVSVVVTGLVLGAFLHGTRRDRMGNAIAGAGRWVLLAGIGGWIGFLLVSRLAILVDRVGFLLGDWLGLVP